jgi:glycosyltransferase involved in cell wall biosynthesis
VIAVALDVRETSHTSAGMLAYVRALRRLLPALAPDIALTAVGGGDNFDLAEQVGLPFALLRSRPQLVHFPTPFVPLFVPAPHVVTVHDAIDLEFPQYAKRKVGAYWRYVVAPVLRSARAVITDDDATVSLLERFLGVDPARVRVIPLGVDPPDPLPQPAARARPYLFYAGNHRPHKDLPTLVRAWSALPAELAADLVMTGPEDAALRALGGRGAAGELVFVGACDERELWALYRGAAAYVQPALREGFGLPVLEALRAGVPAIAARSAIPRALADFVIAFPPGDAAALRELLAAALVAAAGRDPARAVTVPAAIAALTWSRTVRATADVYREAAG